MKYIAALSAAGLVAIVETLHAQTNDAFQSAQLLQGNYVENTADFSTASTQIAEPIPDATAFGRTLWYQWTCPQQGEVTLTARADDGVLGIAAYVGDTWPNLFLVNYAATDFTGTAPIAFKFPVTTGQNVWIQVGKGTPLGVAKPVTWALSLTTKGSLVESLNLPTLATPDNDDFAHAVNLQGNFVSAIAYNIDATTGASDPAGAGMCNCWYTWTASSTGDVRVDLQGYFHNSTLSLGVFTGAQINSLTKVASAAPVFAVSSQSVTFQATQGQKYAISIGENDSYVSSRGPLILTLHATAQTAQTFTMTPAVCLKVATAQGVNYQFQKSADLANWVNFNDPFVGDGSTVTQFLEAETSGHGNFRLVTTP